MSTVEQHHEAASETPLLNAERLANRFAISKRTLWRWRSAKLIPEPIRLGRVVRWRPEEINAWIANGGLQHARESAGRNK